MSIKLKDTIYDLIDNSDKLDNKHASDFATSGHTHSLGNKNAVDLSSTYPSGISVGGIYNNGYPFTYGSTITASGNGGYFQIAGQWNSSVNSSSDYDYPTEMYIRGRRDSYDVWTTWSRVLTNRNYTSFAAKHDHTHSNYASKVTVGTTAYTCSSNNITIPAYPTIPTSLKCPTSLTIQFNGTSQGAWDGSTAKTINITPAAIGAAAAHSHPYLPLSGGTLTGGVGMNSKYLIKPSAEYTCTTTTITGAICITLPASISDTMTSMWIDVYNYVTSTSFSVHVCGYTYTNSTWQHNPSAMVYGANHTVRLGHNGTSFCIYIGETTSTWKYPQVIVRDVIVGYSGNYSNWSKAWTISFVTSFSNVTATLSDYALTTKNWSSICAPVSHTHSQYLTSFPNYAGSSSQGGAATSAAKLTTVSKTAWGQTYWTSGGVPTSISGAMSSVSSITFNNGNNSIIYNPKGEAALHAGESWTILGYGTAGSGKDTYIDGNNIRFRYGTSWTEGMFLTNAGRFGLGINPTAYKADIRATENSDYDIHYYNQTTKSSLFIGKNFWYGTSNTSGEIFSISSGTNADGSGGSRFIRILADGKVGVNTTPSYNLHVVGSTYSSSHIGTGGNLYVSQTAGTGAGISLYSNQSFVQSYGIWCGLGSSWGTVGDCTTGDWHMYFGMDGANNRGWLFRHASNGVVASVASDGNFTTKAWYRTKGGGGWYSIDYGGGWYMNDSSWIRNFNYKPLYININENNTYGTGGHRLAAAFYGSAHVSILLSNTTCGWGICSNNNKNLYFGYRNNTSLTSSTGDTYPMYITPSGYIHATHFEGHSNSATYLYASDSPYRWNDSSPYYMRMRYNINSDNRWYLSVYPETPKSVSVDWAYGADSVDGYHISVGSSAGTNASTIYFVV